MNADHIFCLACAEPIEEGAPTYPDVSGTLCATCAPTFAMLLDEAEAASFVDLETEEPLSLERRRALYDAHMADGGKPDDSMAETAA